MRRVAFAVALGGLLAFRGASAEQGRDRAVLRVGALASIAAGALEGRIAAVPSFQRLTFGQTPETIRRRFLDEVMVPEVLVSLAAARAQLDQQPSVRFAVDRVLARAVVRATTARLGPASSVAPGDVQAYFEANRARYEAPERYQIWRILCRTREDARAVLAAARADPSPKAFSDLARDHSQDKATFLRAGDLGFVAEDGSSNEPGVRVDPSVVRAARTVADGALVPQPVAEGDLFAVVWRRGTIAASKRTVDQVAPQIRDAVLKARVKDETDRLIADLRAARLRDENVALLGTLDLAEPGRARD
jgi:peptidyl-prolyl cis-trans isomerase C